MNIVQSPNLHIVDRTTNVSYASLGSLLTSGTQKKTNDVSHWEAELLLFKQGNYQVGGVWGTHFFGGEFGVKKFLALRAKVKAPTPMVGLLLCAADPPTMGGRN